MASIKDKIGNLQKEIGSTKLMVVTKKRSVADIREVMKAGVKLIGENTLQEIEEKYDLNLFRELQKNEVQLHFIGHLQKNKVNKVVRYCDTIQSVNSIELAQSINAAAKKLKKVMPIFLELNLTGESQKFGLHEDQLAATITTIKNLDHVRLLGLMTIGKQGDEDITRRAFRRCRELANEFKIPEVSMGMSADYPIAVEEGSTMLRLGSAVFL